MRTDPTGLDEAARAGIDLARLAWPRLWGAQTLAAVGLAAIFFAVRGPSVATGEPWLLRTGVLLASLAAAPLWGGLYRLALGVGPRTPGLGGLSFGRDELRLVGLTLAAAIAAILAWLPLVALTALLFILLHDAGQLGLGPLGPVQVSFLAVAAAWFAALGAFVYVDGRLSLAPAATVGEGRLVLARAWSATRGRAGVALIARGLVRAPVLLTLALLALADSFEAQAVILGGAHRWPLADALVGGGLLGAVVGFIQVPMTVGALSSLYRRGPVAEPAAASTGAMFGPELSPG